MDTPSIRPGTPEDLPVIQRVLYEALAWNPEEQLPDIEVVLAHPEAARYHVGWGRVGDIAVIATLDSEPIGAAYGRLFTDEDHGHGFVDEATPEIAIAVWGENRGQGVGGRVLQALEAEALRAGIDRFSLSVDAMNPARRLYIRHGYEVLTDHESSHRMLKTLT